tara:strand:- start:6 stop:332 length:327 start_codon:yes stop_codon:yes gene_type:complete
MTDENANNIVAIFENDETTYSYKSPWIFTSQLMAIRIVAYKRESHPFPERAYVTHIEVDPSCVSDSTLRSHGRYKVMGNYDLTFEEAIEDANRRYMDKKAITPEGWSS